MRRLSDEAFLEQLRPFLPEGVDEAALRTLVVPLKERVRRLADVGAQLTWLTDGAIELPADLLRKHATPPIEAAAALETTAAALETLAPYEPDAIEPALDRVCEGSELSRKRFFMATRIAATGGTVSPPLHLTLAALGSERSVSRLRDAAALLRDHHR